MERWWAKSGTSQGELLQGGIILAGGESRRFGGVDKALLDLGTGRTLLEEVGRRLEFLDELVISTSSADRADRYTKLTGIRACVDCAPGILGGILSGSRNLESKLVFITAADMPFLRRDVIELQFALAGDSQAVVPRHPNGFIEPLHVVLERVPAIRILEEICTREERKVSRLFDSLRTSYVPVEEFTRLDPNLQTFTNINDLTKFREIKSKTSVGVSR